MNLKTAITLITILFCPFIMKGQNGPKNIIKLDEIIFRDSERLNLVVKENFENVNLGEDIHDPLFPHKINIKMRSDNRVTITFYDILPSQIFGYYHSFDSNAFYFVATTEYDVKNILTKYLGKPEIEAELSADNTEDMNMSLLNWSVSGHEIFAKKIFGNLTSKKIQSYLITITNIPLKDLYNFLNRKAF